MLFQVLTQKILSVVIAIRCPKDHVNVIADGLPESVKLPGANRKLMIEFYEDYGAVYPVVEYRAVREFSNPEKPGIIKMFRNFIHAHLRVSLPHITHQQRY